MPIIYRNNSGGNSTEIENIYTVTMTGDIENPSVYEYKERDAVHIIGYSEISMKFDINVSVYDNDKNSVKHEYAPSSGAESSERYSHVKFTMPNKDVKVHIYKLEY